MRMRMLDGRTLRAVGRAVRAGAWVALLGLPGCGAEERSPTPVAPANVLLITLDTTRADHLGLYGYARPTSPVLDLLAKESRVYERAYSTSSWTLPAHASLFTGLVPTTHGARKDPEGELILSAEVATPESWTIYRANAPREDVPTIAELFTAAGWSTGAIVGGPWMKRPFGLARGFQHYDDDDVVADGRRGSAITERARAWLRGAKKPFFLFLNYFDPHTPYGAPASYTKRVLEGRPPPPGLSPDQKQALLYDAEIRYTDDQIGLLLNELRQAGLYDSSWIVVTADHGELLGEHGRTGHGLTLDEVLVRVPLIVKPPAGLWPPARIAEPVLLTDIMPMLLDAIGLPIPDGVQGTVPGRARGPIFAEVNPLPAESEDGDYQAWIEGDWKLLWNSNGRHRLYDLGRDPGESRDLGPDEPARLAEMIDRMNRYVASLPKPDRTRPARPVDKDTAEALRSLGYVE